MDLKYPVFLSCISFLRTGRKNIYVKNFFMNMTYVHMFFWSSKSPKLNNPFTNYLWAKKPWYSPSIFVLFYRELQLICLFTFSVNNDKIVNKIICDLGKVKKSPPNLKWTFCIWYLLKSMDTLWPPRSTLTTEVKMKSLKGSNS